MKNIIIFFCLIVVFAGCKKEVNPLWKFHWGYATADMNDNMWSANGCYAQTNGKDSIGIVFNARDDEQIRESFSVSSIPLKLGKQFLPSEISRNGGVLKGTYMRFMVDGDDDLTCAQYGNLHDADSLQNWVDITEYNPQTKEIKGKFSCNLLRDPEGGNAGERCKPSDPEVIRIRNGVFHTKIAR